MKLKRFLENPILKPRGDDWESVAVFNPSAVYYDGKIHLHYRAVGEYYPYTSRLGYAVFDKELNLIKRYQNPVMEPDWKRWERSIEDPRVTMIDDIFYLTYVTTPTPSPPGGVRRRLGIPKRILRSLSVTISSLRLAPMNGMLSFSLKKLVAVMRSSIDRLTGWVRVMVPKDQPSGLPGWIVWTGK